MSKSASPFQLNSHKVITEILQDSGNTTVKQLEKALRALGQWRQKMLVNTQLNTHGSIVHSGPFKGMIYSESTEGCFLPRLLGCYEAELHSDINNAIQTNYANILDIGCAEGYYAVGMSLRMPNTKIYAHDTNPAAQSACIKLAQANNVGNQVKVGGLFEGIDFEKFSTEKTLLICDIEGGEFDLLQPELYPGLKKIDVIVEVHECLHPGLTKLIEERFSNSHDIIWRNQSISAPRDIPDWANRLSHFDQLLCTWEWRSGSTPWAIMIAKE